MAKKVHTWQQLQYVEVNYRHRFSYELRFTARACYAVQHCIANCSVFDHIQLQIRNNRYHGISNRLNRQKQAYDTLNSKSVLPISQYCHKRYTLYDIGQFE